MFLYNFILFLTFFIFDMVISKGLEVIPERANATYVNPKYVFNFTINIRRYNRKSQYYVNLMGANKQTWNNNITVDFKVGQFLHNEYRPSFVAYHYKLCDLVNKEPYIGGSIRNSGLVCPLPAGYHTVMNVTASTDNFPNVFPFEKGRLEFVLFVTNTGEPVLKIFIEAKFKQK